MMVGSLSGVGNGRDPRDTPGAKAQPRSSSTTFSLNKVFPCAGIGKASAYGPANVLRQNPRFEYMTYEASWIPL
jgi:hypothetical protein